MYSLAHSFLKITTLYEAMIGIRDNGTSFRQFIIGWFLPYNGQYLHRLFLSFLQLWEWITYRGLVNINTCSVDIFFIIFSLLYFLGHFIIMHQQNHIRWNLEISSGTDVHFLNLNSKIFDWKLYANFEILFKFSLYLTLLSRGINSLNFQNLLWENCPLKIEMIHIVMTYWWHTKFMFENKHVMFSGKSQPKHLQLLHSYKQFLLIIVWSALHPDQVKYWYTKVTK